MPYEVKLNQWSGPLEKLLELIEAQELPVGEVSMAKVTDDFLAYLAKFREGGSEGGERFRADLRILADFIAVASRLIFLKSKQLLPGLALTEEEEAGIKDLEERLRRYEALRPALRHLHKLWRANHRSYSRPYLLGRGGFAGAGAAALGRRVFYPDKHISIAELAAALNRIFETVTAYAFETETIKETIVTLEEKISEILARIDREGDVRFKKLSVEKSRAEMIVLFLAILHLAREQIIFLEQMENFSDIMVKKNGVAL